MTSEPDILLLSDDLQRLVENAEERGSVRQSELNEVLEPLALDPLETDAVYRELEKRTIEIVADVLEDGEPAPVTLPAPQPLQVSWETTGADSQPHVSHPFLPKNLKLGSFQLLPQESHESHEFW